MKPAETTKSSMSQIKENKGVENYFKNSSRRILQNSKKSRSRLALCKCCRKYQVVTNNNTNVKFNK